MVRIREVAVTTRELERIISLMKELSGITSLLVLGGREGEFEEILSEAEDRAAVVLKRTFARLETPQERDAMKTELLFLSCNSRHQSMSNLFLVASLCE